METATLTSPPRPVMVQPVQKSMSLPSYARASGEGIDHKLIFAALEQREKVRRKSKVFKDKEKKGTTRQSYFCLPLPSSNKCKETSLSSDTSCSSVEFQKPKYQNPSTKPCKEKNKPLQNGVAQYEVLTPTSNMPNQHYQQYNGESHLSDHAIKNTNTSCFSDPTSKCATSLVKEQVIRVETFRSTVGSSDSMERTEKSSKSSNDSLSRKERLVAIKARVEAERERKLADSSSEEEEEKTSLKITRHNSDGVITRTVREVKIKSSRPERRYRRKTPEDSAARRAARKKHTSLYLPSTTDFDAWKPPVVRSGSSLALYRDIENDGFNQVHNQDKKLQYLYPVAYSRVMAKDSYYSDICGGSYQSRFVKPKVDEIEAKELKNKIDKENIHFHKNANSPTKLVNNSNHMFSDRVKKPLANYHQRTFSDESKSIVKKSPPPFAPFEAVRRCVSPNKAPTPPPRSPKSIEFVNKAIIQHQNSAFTSFSPEARSLERRETQLRSKISSSANINDPNSNALSKDVLNARRRTCSNFSQMGEINCQRSKTPTILQETKFPSQYFPPRSPDLTQKLSSTPPRRTKEGIITDDVNCIKVLNTTESQAKKWEKIELDSEKRFNSLENSKYSPPTWSKWKCLPRKKRSCANCKFSHSSELCSCDGIKKEKTVIVTEMPSEKATNLNLNHGIPAVASSAFSGPFSRLSKSEVNISRIQGTKPPSPETKVRSMPIQQSARESEKSGCCFTTRQDATKNLNHAMQELEDIYRSLKISTENLSEKSTALENPGQVASAVRTQRNSFSSSRPQLISPITFIDDELNLDNKTCFKVIHRNKHIESLSEKSNIFGKSGQIPPATARTENSSLRLISNRAQLNSPVAFNDTSTRLSPCSQETSVNDVLSIEELFSDLTQQLDFEQKLLQETRTKKPPSSPVQKRAVNSASNPQQNKEAALNELEKCNSLVNNVLSCSNENARSVLSNIEQRVLSRKKQKAIRCISANLSSILSQPNTETTSVLSAEESNDFPVMANGIFYQPNAEKDDDKKDIATAHVSRYVNNKKFENAAPGGLLKQTDSESRHFRRMNNDEIWQIRVSMDPGDDPADSGTTTKGDRSPSLRLHSALHKPRMDIHYKDILDTTCSEKEIPSTPRVARDKASTPVPLNETELEKLLNTLLDDVTSEKLADRKNCDSSPVRKLSCANDANTSLSKGEMLVLRHLDVIRNNAPC